MARTSTIEGGLMDHGCRQDQADVPSIFHFPNSCQPWGSGVVAVQERKVASCLNPHLYSFKLNRLGRSNWSYIKQLGGFY